MEFAGKVALVTGTSGIAAATARLLGAAGAAVLACGVDADSNTALALETGITVRHADMASPDEVADAVAAAVSAFGGLDIIVNATAMQPSGTVEESEFSTFMRCLAVNVGSIHLTGHFGIAELRRRGGGAIVNLASIQGHACRPGAAAYVAASGAIHALTRAMAIDHAGDHIRVNSVSDAADAATGFEPEQVAGLIAFLASPRAGLCTGGDYRIDGGLSAILAEPRAR